MPASRAAQRDVEVERARRRRCTVVAVDADIGEAAAQADHHAGNAAVAHQQVGADADHRHRHVGGLGRRGSRARSSRRPAGTCTSAGPPTRNQVTRRERRVRGQAAAHRAAGGRSGASRLRAPSSGPPAARSRVGRRARRSSPGSAWAQAVMLPAPRQTTKSPGSASVGDHARRALAGSASGEHAGGGRARAGPRPARRGRRPRSALAGGVDVGDDHLVGVVEAGAELLEQVCAGACSGAAARRR